MALEIGLIAYAGFANLAASRRKHRPGRAVPGLLAPAPARALGTALLGLSLLAAIARFGGAQGVVAWIGQISLAGTALVLLLSWRPRFALMLGGASVIAALLIALPWGR